MTPKEKGKISSTPWGVLVSGLGGLGPSKCYFSGNISLI